MKVSAIIVTRGDVDLQPVLDSLPPDWEHVVWNNGSGEVRRDGQQVVAWPHVTDLSVYGRYAAIEYASADLIYAQDDDVIVSDPQAIVDAVPLCDQPYVVWDGHPPTPGVHERTRCIEPAGHSGSHLGVGGHWGPNPEHGIFFPQDDASPSGSPSVVCNMPPEFRHDFYVDHALVGFGAAFHRNAPTRAFERLEEWQLQTQGIALRKTSEWFQHTCDIVFTALTPRVLVEVPKTNREFASDDNRMWKQSTHQEERRRMLELVKRVAR